MKSKVIHLWDGDSLCRKDHQSLYELHINNEIDIFNMNKSSLSIKFVGYIEYKIKEQHYQLFSFPKEYQFSEEKIKNDYNKIIKAILNSSKKKRGQGNKKDSHFYTSKIYYLDQIIKHYYQYGILTSIEKEYKRSSSGKINWNKTINSITPKIVNNKIVYDIFKIENKNINISFLSQVIAKVIYEGTNKFDFIFPVINTHINYNEIINMSDEEIISNLLKLKNIVFKDYIHSIINHLISYLTEDNVSTNIGVVVGTNNFELVWEDIVSNALTNKYESQVSYIISKCEKNPKSIKIDHLCDEEKIIIDSKYYKNKDDENSQRMSDYKQLYYNYYKAFNNLVTEGNYSDFSIKDLTYEYSKWLNVYIRPCKGKTNIKDPILFHDGLKLYTLYVNMNDMIDNYISKTSNLNTKNDGVIENLNKHLNEIKKKINTI